MKKEIHKYPYNATTEDETKIFLSDQVCEQVVSVIYRNGTNLFLTTARLTDSERSNLIATNGNFLTERVLLGQQALSTQIQDPTITNNNNNGI